MIQLASRGIVFLVMSAVLAMGSFSLSKTNIPSSAQIPEPQNIIDHNRLIEIQFPMDNNQEIDIFIDKYSNWEETWARVIIKDNKGEIKYQYGNHATHNYWDEDLNWIEFDESLTPKESKFIDILIKSRYLPHGEFEKHNLIKLLERKMNKNVIDITKYIRNK